MVVLAPLLLLEKVLLPKRFKSGLESFTNVLGFVAVALWLGGTILWFVFAVFTER